jgi:DNA-binding transcriptional ArsR family regulator
MPKGKSRNRAAREGGTHLPPLIDPRFIKALDHVLRQHILVAMVQREVSPVELSKAFDEGLSQVSYHVKVLRDDCDGMIEETRRVPRRGAVEHYYRATAKTLLPAKAWRRAKKGMRAVVGAGQASDLFNDLVAALKAGKLQGEHDRIIRTPLLLDVKGQRNVKAIAERAIKEVEEEQRATAERIERANGNGERAVACTFALLAFEAAWEPADVHAFAAHARRIAALENGANGASKSGGGRKTGRRKARATGR